MTHRKIGAWTSSLVKGRCRSGCGVSCRRRDGKQHARRSDVARAVPSVRYCMPTSSDLPTRRASTSGLDYDTIVIGAGISGLYQLYRLRELGQKVRVFESGTGVGGTWYWNRYPGCRFDSESYSYGYSFSQELLDEWTWTEHFAPQPETERYLNHVADKFDLRRDIQFRSRVKSATWDEGHLAWEITLEDGRRCRSRYLVTAVGPLSAPTLPRLAGVEDFRGGLPHRPLAQASRVLRREARGRHRHRGHRRAGHHRDREDGGPPDRLPAPPQLVHAAAQPAHHRGGDGRDPPGLSGALPAVPGDGGLLPAHHRPARHVRSEPGGARGLLGDALLLARLRHLARQLPRHADRSRGERALLRLRGGQDPPAGEGPQGGGAVDSQGPRVRHAPGAPGERLLRGLQPAQRRAGQHPRHPHRAHHADRAAGPAIASSPSTSSFSPPASTPSPAAWTASTSAASAARISRSGGRAASRLSWAS